MFDVSMARMWLGRRISGDDKYLDGLERYVDTLEAGREILVNSRNLMLKKLEAMKKENEELVKRVEQIEGVQQDLIVYVDSIKRIAGAAVHMLTEPGGTKASWGE
jgi:hypothetical protein